jgi:hypothetical protein
MAGYPDGSASYLIAPQLHAEAFPDFIAVRTGTSFAKATVAKDGRAIGGAGPPVTEGLDVHFEFSTSPAERTMPKRGALIEDRAYDD